MLQNKKSRGGLIMLAAMVLLAIFAPLIATHDPSAFSLFDSRQAPSTHHFFGTTDQGNDIFSQVVWGARSSLLLGFGSAVVATLLATTLGIVAAYSGGWIDEIINFTTNVFLVIPTIPLLVVVSAYIKHKGNLSTILILGFTLWAFEARILRRAGAVAAQPRLRARSQGGRGVDLADRLRRADSEHGEPHRRRLRARVLRRAS